VFEIGNSLREARVRQGFEIADLEEQTKIRSKYLRALEDERFELLPGDSYVKGFLRLYADRLGLDGQLYVDEYNSRFSLTEEPVVAQRPGRRARRNRAESHAVVVALVGILAVTVLVIAAWRFGSTAGEEEPPAQPPAAGAPPTTDVGVGEPVELLVTASRGPSRVEVRNDSAFGELVWEGTLREGQSQQFTGVDLWLQIEEPRNLEFRLDGGEAERFRSGSPAVVHASAEGLERIEAG
jgi:hypothetical protein